MSDQSKQDRIAALERELAELRDAGGDDERPLSLSEIREMTKEEASRRWDEIQRRGVAGAGQDDTSRDAGADAGAKRDEPALAGGARIAKAYADRTKGSEQ